jgi:Na+/H+ antiporter NhaD/arsenite permease-like protein
LASIDLSTYVSLAFLFGIAAQFRAMDGFSFLRKIITIFEKRVGVLYAVVIVTSLFSPLILNDVVVLILTPVIIKYAKDFDIDIAPLLVAEITFANIASSLTPPGNPQNILIWSSSKIPFDQFVAGTSIPLLFSGALAAAALFPFRNRFTRPKESISLKGGNYPGIYLAIVILAIILSDLLGWQPYFSLGIGFAIGFFFTSRSLGRIKKEFDVRSLFTLYFFVASVTLASIVLGAVFTQYVSPVSQGVQPYSGVFVGVVSNIISNVPATQMILNVTSISINIAPKLAVEAGLAGNISPIGSFANLLVLLMVRKAGISIKKTIALQFVIGIISFLPALFV